MTSLISQREKQVLQLISHEHNSKEIASQLYISEHTVISHRKNLMIKMDVRNTAGMIRKAFELGILRLSGSVAIVMCLAIFLTSSIDSYAQEACKVEIIQEVLTSDPYESVSGAVKLGSGILYTQYDSISGTELWRSNGSAMSGTLVKDINPGGSSSNPIYLYSVGGSQVFFFAETIGHGYELWSSDGTANGTTMVKDINAGQLSSLGQSAILYPSSTYDPFVGLHDGYLYFVALTQEEGCELWRTDGTTNGTTLVQDFEPGEESSSCRAENYEIFDLPQGMLIGLNVFSNDYEYYISDGSPSGTYLLDEGEELGYEFQGKFYFFSAVPDDSRDHYLMVTDGSLGGTSQIDIFDDYGIMFELNDSLYFNVDDSLRIVKGTTTRAITKLDDIENLGSLGNNQILFGTITGSYNDRKLVKTDGTASGTAAIKDIDLGYAPLSTVYNGIMYFRADDGIHGEELWRTDGTEAGTGMLKDFVPGPERSYIWDFYQANNFLFIHTRDGFYVSDGNNAGTTLIDEVDNRALSNVRDISVIDDVLYFTAFVEGAGHQLIRTNGLQSGTGIVTAADILVSGYDRYGISPSFKGFRYDFAAGDLWKISRDTILRIDADISHGGLYQSWQVTSDRMYYYTYNSFSDLAHLYFIDEDGNLELVDFIDPGDTDREVNICAINDDIALSIQHETDEDAYSLIWTDGTPGGTITLDQDTLGFASIEYLVSVGDKLFFQGAADSTGQELWVSDGTILGTGIVMDLYPGPSDGEPVELTSSGGKLFFKANDGIHGEELWVSDGTTSGTFMVEDINVGINDSDISIFHEHNGVIYFSADDGINAEEIWRSDGTAVGTYMVVEDYFFGDKYFYSPKYRNWLIGTDLYLGITGDVNKLVKLDLLTETLSEVLVGAFSNGFTMNGNLFLRYYENSEYLIGKLTLGIDSIIPIDTAYTRNYSPLIFIDDSLTLIEINDPNIGYQLNVVSCEVLDTCPETASVTGTIAESNTILAANFISVTASIEPPSILSLKAGQYLEFTYPFQVLDNAQLQVDIGSCPD